MSNNNQDLLDLCRLNLMEDNVQDSVAPDKDTTLQAIDYKKRQLVTRLQNNPSPIADNAMKNHIHRNYFEGENDDQN